VPPRLKLIVMALALLALAACARQSGGRAQELVISVRASDKAAAPAEAWAPFLTDMSKATGLKAQTFFGSTDTAGIDALKFRQADLAWFDNAAGMEAVRRTGAEVFARASLTDGSDGYRVALLVRKGSGLTLARILACDRSLALGLGEKTSSIETGAILTYLFGPRAVDPATCFKSVRTASGEANVYAVSAGVLDAAVAATTTMTKVAEAERATLANVETIWASPLIPDSPIVWRKDLDPAIKAKVAKFLFAYGTGEGQTAEQERANLRRIGLRGFVRTDDAHFLVPREMDAAERLRRARERSDWAGAERAQGDLDAVAAERAKRGG